MRLYLNMSLIDTTKHSIGEWLAFSKAVELLDGMTRLHVAEMVRTPFGPTLVADVDDAQQFTKDLFRLANAFHQDAIAVYFPAERMGCMVGPNADLWHPFRESCFTFPSTARSQR